jgi:tetratricopeptide (TPR) repeat protein
MSRTLLSALIVLASLRAPVTAQLASDRDHRDALLHYRLGEEALHGERFEVAEKEFREAVKLDPLLHLAHYGLGQVHMMTKRYSLAVIAFVDARTAFHTGAARVLQDSVLYERQVDDQIRALEDVRRTLDLDERNGPGRPKVADPNATLQRIDAQIGLLKSQRRRSPDRPAETPAWISLALGSAYFRTDALADAEREYREALRADTRLGEAHNNLAVVLMLTRRYDEAEKEIQAAARAGFRVDPRFKDDLKERRKNP